MATITDFTVGLGFDSTAFDRGIRNAERSLGSFKSDVLQVGATLAGAFSLNALSFGFAEQKEGIRQFAQSIGVAADKYSALAQAADSYGASEGELQGVLSQMAKDRAAIAKGQFNYEDLAITGIDWGSIHNAKDDVEALISLADQWQGLNKSQRINTAQYYGLSPQMIDLLNQGEDGVRKLMVTFGKARPYTEGMGDAARRFSQEWAVLSANVGGFADRIAMPFIEDIADIVEAINDWSDANKDWLNSGADLIGEHLTVFAAVVAAFPIAKLAGLIGWLGKLAGLGGGIKGIGSGLLAVGRAFPMIAALTAGISGGMALKDKIVGMDEADANGDGTITNAERADKLEHQAKLNSEQSGEPIPPEVQAKIQELRNTPDKVPENPASSRKAKKAVGYESNEDKLDQIIPGRKERKDNQAITRSEDGKKTLVINNYIDTPAFSRMIVDLDMSTWEAAEQQSKSTTDR